MRKTEDGAYRIDPSPEIEVFEGMLGNICIEIDDEILVILPQFAKPIGEALIALAKEIEERHAE